MPKETEDSSRPVNTTGSIEDDNIEEVKIQISSSSSTYSNKRPATAVMQQLEKHQRHVKQKAEEEAAKKYAAEQERLRLKSTVVVDSLKSALKEIIPNLN